MGQRRASRRFPALPCGAGAQRPDLGGLSLLLAVILQPLALACKGHTAMTTTSARVRLTGAVSVQGSIGQRSGAAHVRSTLPLAVEALARCRTAVSRPSARLHVGSRNCLPVIPASLIRLPGTSHEHALVCFRRIGSAPLGDPRWPTANSELPARERMLRRHHVASLRDIDSLTGGSGQQDLTSTRGGDSRGRVPCQVWFGGGFRGTNRL
jgi:hypothetical protein